jgi:hypothetical protein
MGNRQYHSGRFEHKTETAPEVFSYLEGHFGHPPSVNEVGADLVMPDGTTIEVKSAKEWVKSTWSGAGRRRGRFVFHGYENADYFLFVLVKESGILQLHLEKYITAVSRFGFTGTINWTQFLQFN